MALGQLRDEVSGVPNEAATGLEQALLETRERPTLDGERQDEPAQQIAEVVGDDPDQQADLVSPEAVAGEAGPVGGFLAFLDPLLGRPALVVEADDRSVRPCERGDDEAHPREEFPEVMLDLGDHASRSASGGGLIPEAAVSNKRGAAGPTTGADEKVLDGNLQHLVGREPDGVRHASPR